MDKFNDMICLAAKIDREKEWEEVSRQMDRLLESGDTQAVILGGSNSGKTSIINSLLGTEVKEPDMLSQEDEKPMRITFEKCDEAEEYECHVVMNRKWNDECVVLYEFKSMGALDADGDPVGEMNTKDIIFYVVSALAPLNSEDVRTIKALKEAVPVHVLINKLDMVDEASREKVEKYVQDFCGNLSLPQPVPVDHTDAEAMSKTVRDLLPDVIKRKRLRDNHVNAVYKLCAKKLEKALKEEIVLAKEEEDQKQSEFQEKSLQRRMMRSQWKSLQTDMIEANTRTCREVTEKLNGRVELIAERLFENGLKNHFSEEWEQKILPKMVSDIMLQCLSSMRSKIEVSLAEDVRDIAQAAVEKGLTDSLPMDIPTINVDVAEAVGRERMERNHKSFLQEDKAKIIVGGTAAALGLVLIVPIPLTLTVVGGAAAVAVGSSSYIKGRDEWNESIWKKKLEEYAKANVNNLTKALKAEIDDYCRSVIDCLVEQEEDSSFDVPDDHRNERTEELEEALKACAAL